MQFILHKVYKQYLLIAIILWSGIMAGCKKDWLDAKPDKSLVIPASIPDFQALLDNASSPADYGFNIDQPAMDEISAGDFYMTDAIWGALDPYERNTYIWAKNDFYAGKVNVPDWNSPYKRILTANVVLDGIAGITPAGVQEQKAWNDVKGGALFFRAYEHYSVAQLFCKPYIKTSAAADAGIPLRTAADINAPSTRATVAETYQQILADLKQAKLLLPVELPNTALYKNRPTKTAADAMLARVYLSMSQYDSAFKYADNCLAKYNSLMDYNTISTTSLTPFARFNTEVIFQKLLLFYGSLGASRLIVDSTLYRSYTTSDRRRSCFFRLRSGVNTFKGTYDPSLVPFSGLATDEIYLIRAECYARAGNTNAALADLNNLLITRWNTNTFVPFTAASADEALSIILTERRKELCYRGIRWSDLRRLNQEPRFAMTLTKKTNGQLNTLAPNDPRYVLPIPDNVIQLTGMPQNPR